MQVVTPLRLAGHRTFRSKSLGKILTTTHLNQLYSQTRSVAVFCGHTTYYKGLCTKRRKTFHHNNPQPPCIISRGNGDTMRRSATHILRGMRTRTDDPGHMYTWKHTYLLLKNYILKNKKNFKKWGRGQFSGRAGTLNKYIFLSGQIEKRSTMQERACYN